VRGKDVTPNLRTHLAYPDAQLIHLHGLICAAHTLPLASHRWNVLVVEERVSSLKERASSGSHQTPHAKRRRRFLASVGRLREKRTGTWLEERETWVIPNFTKEGEKKKKLDL
jgi:hypothetical protein